MADQTLILDIGSGFMKAGFAGDELPAVIMPSIYAVPKPNVKMVGTKDYYIGEEALAKRDTFDFLDPPVIHHCDVTNWDYLERMIHYLFYMELRIAPEEVAICMPEPPLLSSKNYRQKMAQLMFESCQAPALVAQNSSVLALKSIGKETGICIEGGAGSFFTVPVINGKAVKQATQRLDIGGRDLTRYLGKLIAESTGQSLSESQLEDYKKQHCYVANDYNEELSVKVPSGELNVSVEATIGNSSFTLNKERFTCAEALFQPNLINVQQVEGISLLAHKSYLLATAQEANDELLDTILLAGGSTLFPGFAERVMKEISLVVEQGKNINVYPQEKPELSQWIGANVYACSGSAAFVTKEEYEEMGEQAFEKWDQ